MEEIDMELYEKLSKLQWLMQRRHMRRHTEHGPMADPTRGQGRVLAMLKLKSDLSTKDLSYLLGIRQQSLNELLNKLEKKEYLTRVPSDADKRVMLLRLTEKGRNAQQTDTDLSGIFDCLSEEEQLAFGDYLDRIIAALLEQSGMEEMDEYEEWMNAARSRMGEEGFEHLMSMGAGFPGRRRGPGRPEPSF